MNLEKSFKKKGSALIFSLVVLSIITGVISLLTFRIKNARELLNERIKFNNIKIEVTKTMEVAKMELHIGDKKINENKSDSIYEYFEGKEKVWLKEKIENENGYTRLKVIQNGIEKTGDIKLLKNQKNVFEIFLKKDIDFLNEKYSLVVNMYYEYEIGINNFDNFFKREIKELLVESSNENFKDK